MKKILLLALLISGCRYPTPMIVPIVKGSASVCSDTPLGYEAIEWWNTTMGSELLKPSVDCDILISGVPEFENPRKAGEALPHILGGSIKYRLDMTDEQKLTVIKHELGHLMGLFDVMDGDGLMGQPYTGSDTLSNEEIKRVKNRWIIQ